jgi:hypothetical protein
MVTVINAITSLEDAMAREQILEMMLPDLHQREVSLSLRPSRGSKAVAPDSTRVLSSAAETAFSCCGKNEVLQ